MFTCNNINLLTFTYYLKIVIASCMTIVPFIYLEMIFIKMIKYKKKFGFINKYYIKKQLKIFSHSLIIFVLAFILHNTLNKETNICYNYATPKVYNKYKNVYKSLKNKNINENIKNNYLENTIIIALNDNSNNNITNNSSNLVNVVKEEVQEEEKKDTFNLNETDLNMQNKVYVSNGVFYYPKYQYGNYKTYTGISCPSNPLNEGFNNPYGYNNYFYTRLTKFVEEASKLGYKITISSQGCRSYQTQVHYYNTMTRGRAAPPGYSYHGLGIASDLEFYHSDGSVCGYGRNDYNCPSMGWAHNNASNFGLTFPLLNASYREDWHIEPINKSGY